MKKHRLYDLPNIELTRRLGLAYEFLFLEEE